jgi:predicted small metal-binding protein
MRGSDVKSFSCGAVVPGCMATFVAEDEDSILRQVAAHAHEDHGMTEVPPAVVEQVRLHIVAA